MKKGIGVGIEDFKKIIDEDCYYFDKTNYIEELLKDKTEIKLFTRPRRFGKTLNMTTLKYFLYYTIFIIIQKTTRNEGRDLWFFYLHIHFIREGFIYVPLYVLSI